MRYDIFTTARIYCGHVDIEWCRDGENYRDFEAHFYSEEGDSMSPKRRSGDRLFWLRFFLIFSSPFR